MKKFDQCAAGFPVEGRYGEFGGSYIPEFLQPVIDEVAYEYQKCQDDPEFKKEYLRLLKEYVGRPSAITECVNLTKIVGGAKIFLKREDVERKLKQTMAEMSNLVKRLEKLNNPTGQLSLFQDL